MSAAILAFAVAQTANAAGPADGGVAARLELPTEAGCAARKDVIASVARRSARIHFVADDPDATSFRASIRPGTKQDFIAELVVVQASGRHSSRRFQVGSCAEGVDALALVIVMTLDPESSARDVGTAASVASAGDSHEQSSSSGARSGSDSGASGSGASRAAAGGASSTAGAAAGKSASAPSGADADDGVAERTDGSPRGAAPHSELTAGAGVQLVSGPAPSWMPGVALQGSWVLERGSMWSPALRLGAGYQWSAEFETTRGTADFALALATLDLCPLVVRPLGVALRPCALAAGGRLTAQGSNLFDPQSVARPFAALGGSLLAVVDIGQKLQLSGNASLGWNLVGDSFLFSPNVFYEVPSLTLLFALSVSYRFSVIE